MDTLQQVPADGNGKADLRELARVLLETMVNAVMDAQADALCEDGANARNGYRERGLVTAVGPITMRIPKLRAGTYFPEGIIERYSRVDRAVAAAVAEMYQNGVSTRKVQKVAGKLGIERLSADQVSAICRSLDEEVSALAERAFEGLEFPYLFLDATYVKCRRDGRVQSTAAVTAIACGADGVRRVVGFSAIDTETYAGWLGFCRDLRKRGVSGVRCVTSDAHEGLKRAIAECFPGAAWQRRAVRLGCDVCSLLKTKRQRAMAGKALQAVFREEDPAVVRCAYHAAIDAIGEMSGEAASLLEGAEADALAYLGFPAEHRRRIRTNNVQERTNRETRRRSRVVQVFPSAESMIRLVGAVMAEQDEDWSSRRWIVPESLARLEEPAPAEPETTEESRMRGLKVVRTAMELADAGRRAA
ncbi:transposase-like protein [Olsenella profusa DSM 13989]|uniref:IS256 family transposase n=1 Tax=Olsenella profusa TaxID=138595 RepID=UPI002780AFC3|nr:IS256 family transposase [Olsenella profusa]MDP9858350.1 transposase-like protein [Olsenella profusa DSM 13989]